MRRCDAPRCHPRPQRQYCARQRRSVSTIFRAWLNCRLLRLRLTFSRRLPPTPTLQHQALHCPGGGPPYRTGIRPAAFMRGAMRMPRARHRFLPVIPARRWRPLLSVRSWDNMSKPSFFDDTIFSDQRHNIRTVPMAATFLSRQQALRRVCASANHSAPRNTRRSLCGIAAIGRFD